MRNLNDLLLSIDAVALESPEDKPKYLEALSKYENAREILKKIYNKIENSTDVSDDTIIKKKEMEARCRRCRESLEFIYNKIKNYNKLSAKERKYRKSQNEKRRREAEARAADSKKLAERDTETLKHRARELKPLNTDDPEKFQELFFLMCDVCTFCREPIRAHHNHFVKTFLPELLKK